MKFSELLEISGLKGCASVMKDADISGFSPVTTADGVDKCVVFVLGEKYIGSIPDSVSLVIASGSIADKLSVDRYGVCICEEPRGLYFELLDVYEERSEADTPTIIGSGCTIHPSAYIADRNVIIGDRVRIGRNVIIEEGTHISSDSVINDGCHIGSQNFLIYSFRGINKQVKCRGTTDIGQNTIILNNTIIGRAAYAYDSTTVGDHCKIGQLVGIGHNSKIGNNVGIYSGCNIAGNVFIEDGATVYTGCTVVNRIHIGESSILNAGSVLVKDIPANEKWMGNPARKIIR